MVSPNTPFDHLAEQPVRYTDNLGPYILAFNFDFTRSADGLRNEARTGLLSKHSGAYELMTAHLQATHIGRSPTATLDEFVELNLDHVYKAETLFTNGQKIASIVRRGSDYEVGLHKSIIHFESFMTGQKAFVGFSFEYLVLNRFASLQRAQAYISHYLSVVEVKLLPTSSPDHPLMLQSNHNWIMRYGVDYVSRPLERDGALLGSHGVLEGIQKYESEFVLRVCQSCKHYMEHFAEDVPSGMCNAAEVDSLNGVHDVYTNPWNFCSSHKPRKDS